MVVGGSVVLFIESFVHALIVFCFFRLYFVRFGFLGIFPMVATFPISCLMAAADFVSFSPFFFGAGDGGGGLGRSVH